MDKKQEFLKRILATFKLEAEENLSNISSYLIELEKGCSEARTEELLELIYRSAHSMKGAARAVNLSELERICHALEDVMSAIRNKSIKLNSELIDLFNDVVDLIHDILFENEGKLDQALSDRMDRVVNNLSCAELGKPFSPILREVVKGVQKLHPQSGVSVKEKVQKKPAKTESSSPLEKDSIQASKERSIKAATSDTIRVSTKKLDKLLNQSEEMLNLKLISAQRTKDLQKILNKLCLIHKEADYVVDAQSAMNIHLKNSKEKQKINSDIEKILQFQDWTNSFIDEITKELKDLNARSQQEDYNIATQVDSLLSDVKEVITVPFSMLMDGYPKMVRDIARDLQKKVDFSVEGDGIEIDRRILENLRTPLMHILRNSVDYGVEDVEMRIAKGKPERGSISVKIEQLENNKVEILIRDDGAGLNKKKLKGLYQKNEGLTEAEMSKVKESEYLNSIFKSGVSTSDIVTDLSGRGLGLAIVQEAIEQMEGLVSVASVEGLSTTFRIVLPISILTFRGVVVQSCNRLFIAPTLKVKSVLRLKKNELKTVKNKLAISYNKTFIPVANLGDLLELPTNDKDSEYLQLLILEVKNRPFALQVDDIKGEQEVLVKSFNKQLQRVRNIAGATVLGTGEVVPILNVLDLYDSLSGVSFSTLSKVPSEDLAKQNEKKILIVEDSITSRTLLKNVLETKGYSVTTAIDGVDGFTKLREFAPFDAVVSDVEMPRMNGFDLTKKIRETKEYEDIPVVLVTSLSKREDRERGIDVGANAYIVKSNFEQNTLFDILDNLI